MTHLRTFLMSAGFAICLPALADTPSGGATIDFEQTVPRDVVTGLPTGDGFALGGYYASGAENAGVTFNSHAFSFFINDGRPGISVDNLPQLPSGDENLVFMAPYISPPTVGILPDCWQNGTDCPVVSTIAEVTLPYSSVTFSYSAGKAPSLDQRPFVHIWSGPAGTGELMAGQGFLDDEFGHFDGCWPNSNQLLCEWHPITLQWTPSQTHWSIEFGGMAGSVAFDNIVFDAAPAISTLIPEPTTGVLALLGLVGVGLGAGRRRQRR
jgi:MYXO-CTERM domain-containing protein